MELINLIKRYRPQLMVMLEAATGMGFVLALYVLGQHVRMDHQNLHALVSRAIAQDQAQQKAQPQSQPPQSQAPAGK